MSNGQSGEVTPYRGPLTRCACVLPPAQNHHNGPPAHLPSLPPVRPSRPTRPHQSTIPYQPLSSRTDTPPPHTIHPSEPPTLSQLRSNAPSHQTCPFPWPITTHPCPALQYPPPPTLVIPNPPLRRNVHPRHSPATPARPPGPRTISNMYQPERENENNVPLRLNSEYSDNITKKRSWRNNALTVQGTAPAPLTRASVLHNIS